MLRNSGKNKTKNLVITFCMVMALSLVRHEIQAFTIRNNNIRNPQNVLIYYFYFTPRCEECYIVENEVKKVIKEFYSNELKNQQLVFRMINLTNPDPASKIIIKELKVRRQLLLVISGGITQNLTKDAFRYAEKQKSQFSKMLITAINQALSQWFYFLIIYKPALRKTSR